MGHTITAEEVHWTKKHPVSLQRAALPRVRRAHAFHGVSGLLFTMTLLVCREKGTTQSFRGRPGRWSTLQALCTSLPFCTGSRGAATLLPGKRSLLCYTS